MQEVCSIWRRRLESSWRCVPWRQRNSCSSPAWTGLSRWEIIGELIHHPTSYKILTAADREPRARPLPQGWHEGHKPRSSSVLSLKRTPRYSSRSTTPRRLWKLCLEGRDLTIRIAQAPTSTLADGRLGKTVVSGSTVRCDLSYNGRRDHRDGHNCIGSLGCGGVATAAVLTAVAASVIRPLLPVAAAASAASSTPAHAAPAQPRRRVRPRQSSFLSSGSLSRRDSPSHRGSLSHNVRRGASILSRDAALGPTRLPHQSLLLEARKLVARARALWFHRLRSSV